MARSSEGALTARDRFWLGHLRAIAGASESATAYARRAGLSVGALWQAKRRLEKLGAWARGPRARESGRGEGAVSFARVAVQSEVAPFPNGVRLRLAQGVELEWPTLPEVEWLAALVERLAARA
jgi:hypothetical protein